jgi:hypothetical protein
MVSGAAPTTPEADLLVRDVRDGLRLRQAESEPEPNGVKREHQIRSDALRFEDLLDGLRSEQSNAIDVAAQRDRRQDPC